MICPKCFVKFPSVIRRCPDCEVALQDLSTMLEPQMSPESLRLALKHEGLD